MQEQEREQLRTSQQRYAQLAAMENRNEAQEAEMQRVWQNINTQSTLMMTTLLTRIYEDQQQNAEPNINNIRQPVYTPTIMDERGIPKFSTRFITSSEETVEYIDALNRYNDKCTLYDKRMAYMQVYNTLPRAFQNHLAKQLADEVTALGAEATEIQKEQKRAEHKTITKIKQEILKEYPPNISRYDLTHKMNRIIINKNERITYTLARVKDHIRRVEETIATINASKEEAKRFPTLQNTEKNGSIL